MSLYLGTCQPIKVLSFTLSHWVNHDIDEGGFVAILKGLGDGPLKLWNCVAEMAITTEHTSHTFIVGLGQQRGGWGAEGRMCPFTDVSKYLLCQASIYTWMGFTANYVSRPKTDQSVNIYQTLYKPEFY